MLISLSVLRRNFYSEKCFASTPIPSTARAFASETLSLRRVRGLRAGQAPIPAVTAPTMYVPIDEMGYTGVAWKDSLPLTTMVFCLMPLYATWRKSLPYQFLCACTSCFVASVYHYMLYARLDSVFGLNADGWRSFDVIIACYCLGITLAYMIHANHLVLHVATRIVVPLAMLTLYLRGSELGDFAKTLIGNSIFVVLGRLAFKTERVPVYNWTYLKYAVPCNAIALFFFPLPVVWPEMYWLYHSLWHVFVGLGLFVCYGFLHTGSYKLRGTKVKPA